MTAARECNHQGANVCDVCAPILEGKSGWEKQCLLETALEVIRAATFAPDAAWTFPREWHVAADRVVTGGGLRESGPV